MLTDVIEMHFLDLQAAKRAKEERQKQNKRRQLINWLCFIGTSDKKERAMLATTSPILQMLNEKIDVLTLSPVERKLYESRMKLKSDITTISESQFNAGWQEGIQKGIQQGMQQGMQQGKSIGLAEGEARGSRHAKLETARILKQLGDSVQKIVQATGLTVQEVEELNS